MVQIALTTFGELRNRATDACSLGSDIKSDSDERVPKRCVTKLALLTEGPKSAADYIPRRNYFMGRWIQGSGWYPNFRQPQFFRKGTIRYTRIVHEAVLCRADGRLETSRTQLCNFRFGISKRSSTKPIVIRLSAPANRRQTRLHVEGVWPRAWAFIKHYIFKLGLH